MSAALSRSPRRLTGMVAAAVVVGLTALTTASPASAGPNPLAAKPAGAADAPASGDGEVDVDALPTGRAHGALFAVPEGWQRGEMSDGTVTLTAPGLKPGERAQINLAKPTTALPDMKAYLVADLDEAKKKLNATVEGDVIARRHPAGFETLTAVLSFHERPVWEKPPKAYLVLVHMDGGPDCVTQPAILWVNSPALMTKYAPVFNEFVASVRLPSRVVLARGGAPGQPDLTLATAQGVNDFLEWLLDVPFTRAQHAAVRDHVAAEWRRDARAGREAVDSILEIRKKFDAMPPQQRELVREAARAEALKVWRGEAPADPMARMMVEVYDAAHAPLAQGAAAGEPPLTRQSADASLEAIYFMASKVAGAVRRDVAPGKAAKDAWAAEMARKYASLPKANKDELAGMPTTWAALNLAWPEIPADQKQKLIEQWSQLPMVQQTLPVVKKEAAAAEQRDLAAIGRAYDAHQMLVHMGAYRLNYRYFYR